MRRFYLAAALAMTLAIPAAAQTAKPLKDRVVGSWSLVSVTVDGPNKIEPYGPHPKGAMFLDTAGRFSIIILRDGLPKFAGNNREKGTADENAAVVGGGISYYGSYTVNEAESSVTVDIEGSSFPNFDGQKQKRLLVFEGDQVAYINPTPSGGGGTAKVLWKRVN